MGYSPSDIQSFAIPPKLADNESVTSEFQNCHQYILPETNSSHSDYSNVNDSISSDQTVPCENGWFYDKVTADFRDSYTEHFNLVCHRKYFLPLSSSIYFLGSIAGRILGGFMADRYGRKPVIIVSCLCTCLIGIGVALSPNIWVFSVLRLLIGLSSNSATVAGIVLWSEITNNKHRNTFGFIFGIHDSFLVPGSTILEAYLLQNWQYLHIAMSAFYGLAIFHPFVISESPQWLLSTNRIKKGIKVVKRTIRLNGRKSLFSTDQLKLMEKNLRIYYNVNIPKGERSTSWKDNKVIVLFTRSDLRRRLLPFLYIWVVIMGSIMGMQYYSVRMKHSNPYVVAFVGCTFSVPVLVLKQFLYHFLDRKRPLIAVFSIAGIVCMVGAGLRGADINGPWNAALATIVLGCALVAQNMCYALTTESFPTVYRSYAMGLASGVGRAGSALSTFVERLDVYIWSGLPLLIFGLLSFLAAWVVHSIPRLQTEEEQLIVEERHRRSTILSSEEDVEAYKLIIANKHAKITEKKNDDDEENNNDSYGTSDLESKS